MSLIERGFYIMKQQEKITPNTQNYPLITTQIVTLNDVIKATSLSRSTIYRMVKSGTFPQPLALTSKRCGFYAHEVSEWISSRSRQSNPLIHSDN